MNSMKPIPSGPQGCKTIFVYFILNGTTLQMQVDQKPRMSVFYFDYMAITWMDPGFFVGAPTLGRGGVWGLYNVAN